MIGTLDDTASIYQRLTLLSSSTDSSTKSATFDKLNTPAIFPHLFCDKEIDGHPDDHGGLLRTHLSNIESCQASSSSNTSSEKSVSTGELSNGSIFNFQFRNIGPSEKLESPKSGSLVLLKHVDEEDLLDITDSHVEEELIKQTEILMQVSPAPVDFGQVKAMVEESLKLSPKYLSQQDGKWATKSKTIIKMTIVSDVYQASCEC